jgi:hypothetical protein
VAWLQALQGKCVYVHLLSGNRSMLVQKIWALIICLRDCYLLESRIRSRMCWISVNVMVCMLVLIGA